MAKLHGLGLTLLALATIATIGYIDYETGPDIGFSLFYLAPVVFIALRRPLPHSALTAVSAALTWLFADLSLHKPEYSIISVWNGTTRLTIFLSIAALISKLNKEREKVFKLNHDLEALLKIEEELARTDQLTGLPNSRQFLEVLERELARKKRESTSLALVYIDLDNFKKVNDTFGHACGDKLLAQVGQEMSSSIRGLDFPGRLGGDEFAILFPGADPSVIKVILQRLKDGIDEIGLEFPGTGFSATFGVVFAEGHEDGKSLMRRADETMYSAKRQGKSRVATG